MDQTQNNKRIAKNTLLLYGRMLITMLVALYTSRGVLNTLGVVDYGIYNAVGGFVAMFTMISGSFSSSFSRYLTYSLGQNDLDRLSEVFNTSMKTQYALAFIILLVGEIGGIWFLNEKMSVPEDRMYAANWVFQLSLAAFVVNMTSTPYSADVISHEKMDAYAYISIADALLKLAVVFLLFISSADKLISYSFLLLIESIIIRETYHFYCIKHFAECRLTKKFDGSLFKEMLGFAGWNFFGVSTNVLRDQGVNMIINVFCGPAVNAARGVACQVNAAVSAFAVNFTTALNPQIIKSYANGDREYMFKLIFKGARFSCYLLLFLSLPILLETPAILKLWLKILPDHSVLFTRLMLIAAICDSLANPLIIAAQANGRLRTYALVVGIISVFNFPCSYVAMRLGWIPESTVYISIFFIIVCLLARIYLLNGMIGLPPFKFCRKVILNVFIVALLSYIFPYLLSNQLNEGFMSFVIICLSSFVSSAFVMFYIGCSKSERALILSVVRKFMCNKNNH